MTGVTRKVTVEGLVSDLRNTATCGSHTFQVHGGSNVAAGANRWTSAEFGLLFCLPVHCFWMLLVFLCMFGTLVHVGSLSLSLPLPALLRFATSFLNWSGPEQLLQGLHRDLWLENAAVGPQATSTSHNYTITIMSGVTMLHESKLYGDEMG